MEKLKVQSRKIFGLLVVTVLLITLVPDVSAHVAVSPKEVGIAKFQTFTVGVPVEKDIATVAVRLVIPSGLEHVTPNAKPGWTISTKHAEVTTTSESEDDDHHAEGPVVEITWTGGSIPVGQRDDFLFSAKVPSEETTLKWKAYQTYADGTIVSWDLEKDAQPKDSAGKDDFSKSGPLSETKIINDLKNTDKQTMVQSSTNESKQESNIPLLFSILALVASGFSIWKTYKK